MQDGGGIPWVVIDIGIVVLGLALAYGIFRGRRLSAGQKSAQQRQTHDNFRVDEDSA